MLQHHAEMFMSLRCYRAPTARASQHHAAIWNVDDTAGRTQACTERAAIGARDLDAGRRAACGEGYGGTIDFRNNGVGGLHLIHEHGDQRVLTVHTVRLGFAGVGDDDAAVAHPQRNR